MAIDGVTALQKSLGGCNRCDLDMKQKCALAAKRSCSSLVSMRKNRARRSGKGLYLYCQSLLLHMYILHSVSPPQCRKDTWVSFHKLKWIHLRATKLDGTEALNLYGNAMWGRLVHCREIITLGIPSSNTSVLTGRSSRR